MVAHHRERGFGVHHATSHIDRPDLRRPAIDEVADEDRGPLRMPPRAGPLAIAHEAQQRFELVRMAVDVADDIEGVRSCFLHE